MKQKTLEETLKENQLRRREFIKQCILENKKEQKKQQVIITITIILIMTMLMIIMNLYNKTQMNSCMSAGNSKTYCEEGI